MQPIRITANLSSPLRVTGDDVALNGPHLDGIIRSYMDGYKIGHSLFSTGVIDGVEIDHCSSPIILSLSTQVDHKAKRFASENSDMIMMEKRRKIPASTGPLKSYYLPMQSEVVDKVIWFACVKSKPGKVKQVRKFLRQKVHSVGKDTNIGYGVVDSWEVDRIQNNYSFFCDTKNGVILMRCLPFCDELPKGLAGSRVDYGACRYPYSNPANYREIVVPC